MRQPAIFLGHGSPMNAILNNAFTREWQDLGKRFKPRAILMISAHWETHGSKIQKTEVPKKINDMGGFPRELYELEYPVKGSFDLSDKVMTLLNAEVDNSWGIDHGAWSILVHMYPEADIPVVQLSLDKNLSAKQHYEIGKALRSLRDEGFMIIGSGNVVHSFQYMNASDDQVAFAQVFDTYIKEAILTGDHDAVINYTDSPAAPKAVPSKEHFDPLLYVLGAGISDPVEVINNKIVFGSFSMTSYIFT